MKKTVIIPNGVNIRRFQKLKKRRNSSYTIVTSSSLIPRNGIDTLIQACYLLPKNLKWKLLIAGDGPELSKLMLITRENQLSGRIKFLGRISNEEIPKLLSQADIFVRPSRREGFGVAFLEAMAAGVPVVATPVGGIVDFLKNEKTGLLTKPDNPKQTADNIERLMTDTNLYNQIVKNGKLLVKNNFNWDKISNEVEKNLKSIS